MVGAGGEPHASQELILQSLEGHRRHRLFDESGQEIQRFHDNVSEATEQVLDLLGIDRQAYGLD